MPLVWAHAEHLKLCRSLREGRVFDMPRQTVQRYQVERIAAPLMIWRRNHKCQTIPPNKTLRLESLAPAVVRWSADDWQTCQETETRDTGIGLHIADLPVDALPPGTVVRFTFYQTKAGEWEGTDFEVGIERTN
jgi:glucoamylase